MLTDPPLRKALKRLVLPAGLRVVDELNAGYGRADVVTIGTELHGYEIKASNDNLSRLRDQIPCYNRVFDKITLVTTMRHADRALEIIPDHWGVLVAVPAADCTEVNSFFSARDASINPEQEIHFVLDLLWRDELKEFLRERGAARGCRNSMEMRIRAQSILTPDEARQFAYTTLLQRENWKFATPKL